jgi:hypothetical protein
LNTEPGSEVPYAIEAGLLQLTEGIAFVIVSVADPFAA